MGDNMKLAGDIYAVVLLDDLLLQEANAKDQLNFAFFIPSTPSDRPETHELEQGRLWFFNRADGRVRKVERFTPFEPGAWENVGMGPPRVICKMIRNVKVGITNEYLNDVLSHVEFQGQGPIPLPWKAWFTAAIRLLKKREALAHAPRMPKTDDLVKWLEDNAVLRGARMQMLDINDLLPGPSGILNHPAMP